MENLDIDSSFLPFLGGHTKNLINQGVWFLYRVETYQNPNAAFLLVTDEKSYFLDETGAILSESIEKTVDVNLEQAVYFSDIPTPRTISNLQFA